MSAGPAWLPGLGASFEPENRLSGMTVAGTPFSVPALSAADAATAADYARNAALAARRTHRIADVITAISRAALRLADPNDPTGARAVAALETSGGWPRQAAEDLLASNAAGWTEDSLTSLVRMELGDPALLDGPQSDPDHPGRRRQAIGPPALLLVLAGNVPGVAVTAVLRGLLVRSAVLCKLPQDEPDLVGLFARVLHEEDAALGATIAATWWPADQPGPAADEWTKRSGKVIVYGGADAVSGLRARTPPEIPLVEYGPRLGIACLGADVSDEELAALARDACAYDQAGCVSPRLVFLLGDFSGRSAESVADTETEDTNETGDSKDPVVTGDTDSIQNAVLERLAAALSAEATDSPGSPIREAEAVALRAARSRYQFSAEEGTRAFGADDLGWSLLYRNMPGTYSEGLPRTLWAYRATDMDDLRALGAVLEGRVQALGVAGLDPATIEALEQLAVEWGVSRVVPVGGMAWPPPDWRHDGRYQLLPLLRWTEFE